MLRNMDLHNLACLVKWYWLKILEAGILFVGAIHHQKTNEKLTEAQVLDLVAWGTTLPLHVGHNLEGTVHR